MTSTSDSDLTDDAFLGGRLNILQPRIGYRAGVDPVLLAAAVPARSGDTILDLGCGVGTAFLCLHARVADLAITGIEMQSDYATLARRNTARNTAKATIHATDLRDLPSDVRARRFTHVIANPPYYDRTKGTAARDTGRDLAFAGDTTLADWITTAARRVAPKGYVTIIQRADRLPELLNALPAMLGSVTVLPIAGRTDRNADRIILQARHRGRAPFQLRAPLVLHNGLSHGSDAPDYTAQADDILRNAAALGIQS